ncbi:MAG: hypothetical protein COA47_11250 [Robiginitomaculum sp.]|nr:MAG: hypothetical protein COA47_11250 [Robiginitomaculum sp.]
MSKAPAEKIPFPTSQCVFNGYSAARGHQGLLLRRIGLPFGVLIFLLYGSALYVTSIVLSDFPLFSEVMTAEAVGKLTILYGSIIIFNLLIMTSGINAAFRWYLTGDLGGYIGALRFGMDEMRTLGVLLAYWLLVFTLPYIVMIVVVVLGIAISVSLSSFASTMAVGTLFLLAIPSLFAAMVYLSVKLSLCVPLSLERKKFTMFASFRLTRKRGWELLGCYVIMGLIYMVGIVAISTFQNIMFMRRITPLFADSDFMTSDVAAAFEAMSNMLTSPVALAGLVILVFFQALIGLLFLFGYTGLTAFSLRFLQKEKGHFSAS